MFDAGSLFSKHWYAAGFSLLIASLFSLGLLGCGNTEEYTGTIESHSFFVESQNNIPLYAIKLSELPEKTFIIDKEHVEQFGFEIIEQSSSITLNGREISISNVWFDSANTKYIGKKVTVRAKSKVFFQDNDGEDIGNHYAVLQVDWIE